MPAQGTPVLEIDADFGGNIGQKTGRFEFPGGDEGRWSLEQEIRTGFILNSAFDDLAALFTDLTSTGDADRKGLSLDVGGGEHAITLEFQVPRATTNPDTGSIAQWGSSGDETVGPNRHTATGADKVQQMQVLMEYLRVASPDSVSPARFTYGEYALSGTLDSKLAVAIEQPSVRVDNTDPYWADGTLTMVETRDLTNAGDAASREAF